MAPRHQRRQRQQDKALLEIAAARARQQRHHGAASYRQGMPRTRCLANDCCLMFPNLEPQFTTSDACSRCGMPVASNPDATDEYRYQQLKRNGGLPACARGTGKGGKGKDAGKGTQGKGMGNGGKGIFLEKEAREAKAKAKARMLAMGAPPGPWQPKGPRRRNFWISKQTTSPKRRNL